MLAVIYVVATTALVVLWGLLSSRFPRLGLVANAAAIVFLIQNVLRWELGEPSSTGGIVMIALGLGWTILGFITAGFGMLAAIGGLIELRQCTTEGVALPRAIHLR